MLRQARSSGYGEGGAGVPGQATRRSFPLMPEEVSAIGEKAVCVKAYGSHDGSQFTIDRIEPETGASNQDAIMVQPTTQLSPS